jgi:recombination protein RecT
MVQIMNTGTNIVKAIVAVEPKFNALIDKSAAGQMTFAKEASFARQAFESNHHLANAIRNDVKGFQDALCNVANMGLSLNPSLGYAYLVPRKGKICLDPSYKGLVKIAVKNGFIRHAMGDIVKEGDHFIYKGMYDMPEHDIADIFAINPSRSQKKTVGAYCVAKMPDGSFMTHVMDLAEIEKRKALSMNKGEHSIWNKWYDQMCIKTVIKYASKSWISNSGIELEEKFNEIFSDDFSEEKNKIKNNDAQNFIEGTSDGGDQYIEFQLEEIEEN